MARAKLTAQERQARQFASLISGLVADGRSDETKAREQRSAARARWVKRARSWRWRNRCPLWVVLATVGVWVAGRVASVWLPVLTAALLVLLACVVVVVGTRHWRSEPDRLWAVVPSVLAGGYVALSAAGVAVTVLLWVGGAVVAGRWALSRRVRPTESASAPEPTPTAPVPAEAPGLAELWEQRVAAGGGALPGSSLSAVGPITNGTEAVVALVPGRQSTGDAMAAAGRVTSALERPRGSVMVEPTADRVESRARLLVLDRNPLHETKLWATPTLSLETGTAVTGVYADDEPARLRWLTPGSGAVNGLVAGAPGWGKSRELDLILCESRAATYLHPESGRPVPWVHTWIADGQEGQSLPDWLDITSWAATSTAETLRMLRAATRVMQARSKFLARFEWVDGKGRRRRGMKHFDPVATGMPLLEVVIDECHGPLGESVEAVALSIELARKGRKCGIRLVFATQVPSVENLGNSIQLRSLLAQNVVCFRTRDRLSGGMAFAGGMAGIDPSELPEEFPNGEPAQGLAYLLGPGARQSPMRSLLVEDPFDVAVDLPCAELHAVDLRAAGADFESWRDRRDVEEGGTQVLPPPDLHVVPPAEQQPPSPAETAVDESSRALVLDAVSRAAGERGRVSRAELIEALEQRVKLRTLSAALAALVESGEVERLERGVYGLPPTAEGAA